MTTDSPGKSAIESMEGINNFYYENYTNLVYINWLSNKQVQTKTLCTSTEFSVIFLV